MATLASKDSSVSQTQEKNESHDKSENSKNAWKKLFDEDVEDHHVEELARQKLKCKSVIAQDSVFSLRDVDKKVFVPLSALSDAFTGTGSSTPLMGSSKQKDSSTAPRSRPFEEFAVGTVSDDGTYGKTDGTDS